MSVTLNFDLKGLTSPITVHSEYTDASVNGFWADGFNVISEVFELPTVTDSDVLALFTALTQLKLGAVNGIDSATGQPVPAGEEPEGRRFFLTYGMADSLDRLLKSLESVGFNTVNIPVTGDPDRITQLERWQDLDDVGLREILILMGDAVVNNRTLQAMIELEYVKAGNDIIGDNLEDLDEALRITRDTLDSLERAQTLKNKLEAAIRDINTGSSDPFDANTWDLRDFDRASDFAGEPEYNNRIKDPKTYQNLYEREMKRAYNEALGVEIIFNEADLTEYGIVMNDLAQLRAQLQAISPDAPLIEKIDALLDDMMRTPDGERPIDIPDVNLTYNVGDDPRSFPFGSSYDFSFENFDISAQREDNLNRMLFWIYDGYAVSDQVESGVYQRNLTAAIVAAQNLNDTQKEDLRRFMYLFEQFYKSASAILQAIDRMVNKMAQNIKG